MKRLSLFLALSFVLLSFGLANAIQFNWVVAPGSMWNDGVDDIIIPNQPVDFELQWANNDGKDWTGFNFNQKVYGTGDVATITWLNGNRGDLTPGISTVNGIWEGWSATDNMFGFSWDGTLPDTMSHSVLDFGGWPDGDPLATHYIWHMNISMAFQDPGPQLSGQICFDSTGHWNTDRLWLFTGGMNYGGPYCWKVEIPPDMAPTLDCPDPLQLVTQHHVAYDINMDMYDAENTGGFDVVASVGTATFHADPGAQGKVGYVNWTYDPPCEWVGQSNSVTIYGIDAINGGVNPGCTIDLVVNNLPPEISGECDAEYTVGTNTAGLTYQFNVTDGNSGDIAIWSITDPTPGIFDGDASIVDGVLTINTGAEEGTFVFEVCVMDCNDEVDCCNLTLHVLGTLPFAISIEKDEGEDPDVPGAIQGQHTFVEVYKMAGTDEMHGFDLLIAYDATALAFMGAIPGDLFDMGGNYQWEYFNYRYGPFGNCGNGCPSGLLRVVAIADQNDGAHNPLTNDVPDGMVLFTLDFLVSNDRTLECSFAPISFFFMDCGDNSVAFYDATEPEFMIRQGLSLAVYNYDGTDPEIWNSTDLVAAPHGTLLVPYLPDHFPNYWGHLDECIDPYDPPRDMKGNKRWVTFYNGGVDIVCGDEIDDRGDVNLNGVAYEIADAVTLTNYFIYGMAAFQINIDGQTAASDVNADGIPLSVADLVYLIRVVVGDALPYPKLNPNATPARFAQADNLISVDAELGAAAFVLEGNVAVELADGARNMDLKVASDGEHTYALVYSFEKNATFSGNVLNTAGSLVRVEAADYDGTPMKVVNLPTTYAVKSYPNPFNPAATVSMSLPIASDWKLSIYNVAGQKVDMFKGHSEAGTVNVVWDASNFASGIYFYKFEANNTQITKKMVLLK
jgi:hypothetical protein